MNKLVVNYFSNVQSQPTGIFPVVSLTLMLPIQSTEEFEQQDIFPPVINVFSVIITQCIDSLSCSAAAFTCFLPPASPAVWWRDCGGRLSVFLHLNACLQCVYENLELTLNCERRVFTIARTQAFTTTFTKRKRSEFRFMSSSVFCVFW